MQPSRSRHREADKFGDDRPEPAERKRLFHGSKDVLFPVSLDEDDAVWMEARLCQRRKKQVRPCQAPDDLPLCSRSNPSCKQRCSRTIDGPCPATGKLVDRPKGQSSTRQVVIDLADAKW